MEATGGIILVAGSMGDEVMRRFAGRCEDVIGFDRQAPQPAPEACV